MPVTVSTPKQRLIEQSKGLASSIRSSYFQEIHTFNIKVYYILFSDVIPLCKVDSMAVAMIKNNSFLKINVGQGSEYEV